jgi:GNAT superfamily N-acetyltransferase
MLRTLTAADLVEATALLARALPWDGVSVVAQEKLFAGNGRRHGQALGAFSAAGELLGVIAYAGRFIKLLAVAPDAQRRGIGTTLLDSMRAAMPTQGDRVRLRVGDHPGNYLSPGVDERYTAAHAFFRARGFGEAGRGLNLRAPLIDNPLCTRERLQRQIDTAAAAGYTVRRAQAADVPGLLAMVESQFSWVWAYEVARALGLQLGGEAAAQTPALPEGAAVHVALDSTSAVVAFAAHDGNNRGLGWFGPMGTLPAHRGRGLGEVLVLACLADTGDRPEGGVIAWVGPVDFYARACGAVPDRRFVSYEEP